MKKTIILSSIAIASALILTGCIKEIAPEIVNDNLVSFTINAKAPETRTYFEYDGVKTYTPKWHNGDELGVFFNTWVASAALTTTFSNTLSDGATASFSGTGEVSGDEQTIYAFYPASQFGATYANHVIGFTIPGTQKPTATSFDKNADILVNKPYPITIDNTSVVIDNMQFRRILSVLKLVIIDGTTGSTLSSDKIKSVTLTTKTSSDEDGEPLTGRYHWDFENESGVMNGSVKSNVISANLKANPIAFSEGTSGPIYLMVNPTTLPQNSKLIIDIATDNHDITKTATLSAKAFEFPAGNVAKLSITITDSDTVEDAPVEPAGTGWFLVQDVDWLKAGDKVVITDVTPSYSLNSQSTNNWSTTSVSITDGKLNVGSAAQFTLATGSRDGTFAFKTSSNTYLHSNGDNNHLKSTLTEVTDSSSWTITATKTSTTIFNVDQSSREIQLNGTSIFSTYKSTQKPVRIYKQYTQPELAALSITVTPDHANKTITVTWDDVEHATNYAVACTGQSTQNIAPGVQTAVFDEGLSYGTEYTITVTASAAGYVSSSDSDVVTLVNPAAKTITRLKASITGVAAAGVTDASESGVYSLTNATDGDLTVTPDGTVVTAASASSGTVTYTVANNTGAARNGSITIEVSGGNSIEITVSQLASSATYSFAFATIGTTGWSNSYADHDAVYDDAIVTIDLKSASKQTSNVTAYPVTKAGDVIVKMNNDHTLTSITFTLTQWTTKSKNVSLQYSTNGGSSYSDFSPAVSSSSFSITKSSLPSGTNAIKLVQGDTGNQVGLVSVEFSYN